MSAPSVVPLEVSYDPRSPQNLVDPYAGLGQLRAESPVCIDRDTGIWFLLRFDDVQDGLTNIVRNEDQQGRRREHFPRNPFAADGPPHTGPRRVVMPALAHKAVQQYRQRAQGIVDTALANKKNGSELSVVREIGFPLPYHLTCQILGVPAVGNLEELREWTWRSLELIDAFLTPEEIDRNLQLSGLLAAHLHEVMEWKRDHLDDDLLSTIIAAADKGEVMDTDQLVSFVHTLYLAGMHTTINQTALSLLALFDQREQWQLLLDRPSLLGNAVEEVLRFEPTAQYMQRTTTTEYILGDVAIPPETQIVCWIASANRDEARWGPDADRLDITRADARQHVAFGRGPHTCVGSWLARLELDVVVSTIAERFPHTVVADTTLVWPSDVIRGPEELVLELRS